ncbi:MAG TPA: hypothetical protein VGN37_23655 [Actinocatenispora sp.]
MVSHAIGARGGLEPTGLAATAAALPPDALTDLDNGPDDRAEFSSFAALLEAAEWLPGLRLSLDRAVAEPLDNHSKAAGWRRKRGWPSRPSRTTPSAKSNAGASTARPDPNTRR